MNRAMVRARADETLGGTTRAVGVAVVEDDVVRSRRHADDAVVTRTKRAAPATVATPGQRAERRSSPGTCLCA